MERDAATGLYRTGALEVVDVDDRSAQKVSTDLAVRHGVIVEQLDDRGPNGHVQFRLYGKDTDALTKAVEDLERRATD